MRLSKVALEGFGQFNRGLEVDFSLDGLTVVLGRNEAGKSTLLNAVFGVLFGFRDLNQARKYEPWDEHQAYAGRVVLTADDGRLIVIRRDFETDQTSIREERPEGEHLVFEGRADPRGNGSDDREYFRRLGEILGFQDEAVFRNTVFFGQQSLQTSVSDQIRRLLSGSGQVDFKGALHELHGRHSELTTENPWRQKAKARPRLIESTRAKLVRDRERLAEGRELLERSLALEGDIVMLGARVDEAGEDLRRARARTELLDRYAGLLARRDAVKARYDEALARRDRLHRYVGRTEEIQRELAQRYSHIRSLGAEFPERVRDAAAADEARQGDAHAAEEARQRLMQLRPRPNTALAWGLGAVLLIAGLALGALTALGIAAGAFAGVALGALGLALGRHLGTGFRRDKAALEREVRNLEDSAAANAARLEEIRKTYPGVMTGRGPREVLEEWTRYRELHDERDRVEAAIKGLGDRPAVERGFDAASQEQGAVTSAIEELVAESGDESLPADREAMARSLAEARSRATALEAERERHRAELEARRVELAGLASRMDFDLASLEEGIREEERRLERFDLERDALKEAIDTLDGCIKDLQEGDLFRLSDDISTIFARVTGEKYSRVHLGSSMEPVVSRGDNVSIAPTDLSQGARDQLYFAMRIAMARHLSRDVCLPLFLDDPFVNFDAERLEVTRDVLERLGEHQVILVTCNREYRSWSRALIDLDELKGAAA